MCVYGFEISYNYKKPLRCFSSERGGVSAHLYTVKGGQLQLDVTVKRKSGIVEYSLPAIASGDVLSFKYLKRTRIGQQSIAKLNQLARKPLPRSRPQKIRLGLDFRLNDGYTVRTSHPNNGGFSFRLANIPLDHARAFVMAWNRKENWHWQLADLYPDGVISFHVVETDWCNAPPTGK